MRTVRTVLATLLCTFTLIIAADYAALASTGQSLLLGRFNSSDRATTVSRSTGGPVLNLQTSTTSSAPLQVNGSGKVVNLNADRLDGLDSTALRTSARVFQASVGSPRVAMDVKLPLTPGSYLLTFNARLTTTSNTAGCEFLRLNPDGSGRYFGGASDYDPSADSVGHSVVGTSYVNLGTGVALHFECGVPAGQTFTAPNNAIQVVATRIDSASVSTLMPTTARTLR